jgi:hypothetical protein
VHSAPRDAEGAVHAFLATLVASQRPAAASTEATAQLLEAAVQAYAAERPSRNSRTGQSALQASFAYGAACKAMRAVLNTLAPARSPRNESRSQLLSEYELTRLRNINVNQEMLAYLGLNY